MSKDGDNTAIVPVGTLDSNTDESVEPIIWSGDEEKRLVRK